MNLQKKFILLIIVLISIFSLCLGIFLENLFVGFIPIAILGFIYLLSDRKKFATTLIISTAISIPLSYFIVLDFDFFIVSEILLVVLLFLYLIEFLRNKFPQDLLTNKISGVILAYLLWSIITCFFSQIQLVSVKVSLVRIWFVAGFFFFPLILFSKNEFSISRYFTIFILGSSLVIIFALTRHYIYGIWYKKIAYWAANPFFPDHTSYGALLSMFIPMLGLVTFSRNFPLNIVWDLAFYFFYS